MTEQQVRYPGKLEVQNKVKHAIERLLSYDGYLIEHDVNERSISHRLALYLQGEFGEEWHVDCEYNRNHDIKKMLNLPSNNGERTDVTREDTKAKTVFPDIIVHQRGTNDHNLLVIEMKKTNNARESEVQFDLDKLHAYKKQYDYHHTLYLQLRTECEIGIDKMQWDGD